MMRPFDARLVVALALGAALSTALGCERSASGLTEWTPADHDHQTEPKMRHNMQTQAQRSNPHAAPGTKDQVIDVTWMKQCATCHGRRGKGDGPSSTMVKARDLTNAEFQATLTDEQIAKVIREGKDKMPAFNLPDSIIQGLVQHVRGMARKRAGQANDDGVEPGDDDATEQAAAAPANAPAANAPASTGNAPSPAPSAAPPGSADKTPPLPTQAPSPQQHGAATPAATAPSAPPSAPAPSAPHP